MTEMVHERCCGLDVHKDTIVACLLTPEGKKIRTFGTTTGMLRQLVSWLEEANCTHVAMESTGVYWKPLYNLLEETAMVVVVANPQKIKVIPGRKTDVKDAEWIADLLRHGLLRASVIPDRPQRELRELTRYRTTLIREGAAERNRIQKTLEGAGFKLGSVASDVLGRSGRLMLEALVEGTTDAATAARDGRAGAAARPVTSLSARAPGRHARWCR